MKDRSLIWHFFRMIHFENCTKSGFFLVGIFPDSVQKRKTTGQKKTLFEHLSPEWLEMTQNKSLRLTFFGVKRLQIFEKKKKIHK